MAKFLIMMAKPSLCCVEGCMLIQYQSMSFVVAGTANCIICVPYGISVGVNSVGKYTKIPQLQLQSSVHTTKLLYLEKIRKNAERKSIRFYCP